MVAGRSLTNSLRRSRLSGLLVVGSEALNLVVVGSNPTAGTGKGVVRMGRGPP